ncbi:nuclease-related domain-containing protein [Shewanella sp. SR44-3]|uniref:nuclease-related domain-containing protein n=1 Tax=Shewanella sp. SR44-3 TaxID=2760936 RepID=UPI0015FC4171|nr:nuclease-related domain-containing protein [Shewanella sp. SR44-3]MBB1270816.1 NERD domain-containing protein [Shewanella sp. SR44-3]
MILKTKSLQYTQTPQAQAGQKQEQSVAFFLRRAFKDHPEILVVNDFKFSFNDETAQIDHLLIYRYGFVLIESKSIKGHVKVNSQGEWSRSYNNHWSGMPSPIKQVELQQALLRELLKHHKSEILGKLLGIKQQGFNGRCWVHLCVVSSDAVIDRETMPSTISNKLVKTEFLVEKLEEIMNLKNKFMRLISVADTRPDFSQAELNSVGEFIIAQHIDSNQAPNQATPQVAKAARAQEPKPQFEVQPQTTKTTQTVKNTAASAAMATLSCKHCGESTNYSPMYGKYGYYITCKQCSKNTPMKQACPQCHSPKTKVSKRKETYTLNCQDCSHENQLV